METIGDSDSKDAIITSDIKIKYFGSIGFFKHLIICFFVICFTLPVVLSIGILYGVTIQYQNHIYAETYSSGKSNFSELNSYILSSDFFSSAESSNASTLISSGSSLNETSIINSSDANSSEYSSTLLSSEISPSESTSYESEIVKKDYQPIITVLKPAIYSDSLTGYQLMYENLYATPPEISVEYPNSIYLTFDDGPSQTTSKILDTLKKYDIKATFFVVGGGNKQGAALLNRIVSEGHTLGVHSSTHKYKEIYKSVEAFLDDFNKEYNLIYESTGIYPNVFRFPGGSINSYNRPIYTSIISEMTRRGFVYYDWNVSATDSSPDSTTKQIVSNTLKSLTQGGRYIVLMHDVSNSKIEGVLEEIIITIREKGFTFRQIDNSVKPIVLGH